MVALAQGSGGASIVQVSVRDVGATMPADARRMLLAPRREDSVSDEPALGVSLEIAREAIEGLGGRIAVRATESPAETEFVLELPSRRAGDVPR